MKRRKKSELVDTDEDTGGFMSNGIKEIHPFIVNQHKALIDLIEFTKKRQWAITNYSVLIYAGIFAVAYNFDQKSDLERK